MKQVYWSLSALRDKMMLRHDWHLVLPYEHARHPQPTHRQGALRVNQECVCHATHGRVYVDGTRIGTRDGLAGGEAREGRRAHSVRLGGKVTLGIREIFAFVCAYIRKGVHV